MAPSPDRQDADHGVAGRHLGPHAGAMGVIGRVLIRLGLAGAGVVVALVGAFWHAWVVYLGPVPMPLGMLLV